MRQRIHVRETRTVAQRLYHPIAGLPIISPHGHTEARWFAPPATGFCRAPAAQSFHHAFIGGLLEHTLNAVEVADAIVKFYPGLNRDLVIAESRAAAMR